ncbi:MAG: hypothetical protein EOL97_14295 [Spirochaetia bacterium]|nr:hypothetical protein [Spirochaetia bacterium]
MVIKKFKQESTQVPDDNSVRYLSGTIYELIGNENILEKLKTVDGDEVTVYESNMTHITASISKREDMIVALIRLRYNLDDEFALINKGIEDSQNQDYMNYRSYVGLCKEQALIYF